MDIEKELEWIHKKIQWYFKWVNIKSLNFKIFEIDTENWASTSRAIGLKDIETWAEIMLCDLPYHLKLKYSSLVELELIIDLATYYYQWRWHTDEDYWTTDYYDGDDYINHIERIDENDLNIWWEYLSELFHNNLDKIISINIINNWSNENN